MKVCADTLKVPLKKLYLMQWSCSGTRKGQWEWISLWQRAGVNQQSGRAQTLAAQMKEILLSMTRSPWWQLFSTKLKWSSSDNHGEINWIYWEPTTIKQPGYYLLHHRIIYMNISEVYRIFFEHVRELFYL